MAPVPITPADLAAWLPVGGRVLVTGVTGESVLLAEAVMAAGNAIGPATFTGIFIPGINNHSYLANEGCKVETFFVTPALKGELGLRVTHLPLCYNDIRKRMHMVQIDALLCMVAPPDEAGNCSFGVAVDFAAELWPSIPVRVAHINPLMPRTAGNPGIPFDSSQPMSRAINLSADLRTQRSIRWPTPLPHMSPPGSAMGLRCRQGLARYLARSCVH